MSKEELINMEEKMYSREEVIKIAEYVRVADKSTPTVKTSILVDEYLSTKEKKLNQDGTLAVSLVEEKMIPLSDVIKMMTDWGNTFDNQLPIEEYESKQFMKEWIKENL